MYPKGLAHIVVVVMVFVLLAGGAMYFVVLPKKSSPESDFPVVTNENEVSPEAESKKEETIPGPSIKPKPAALPAPGQPQIFTDKTQKAHDPWRDPIPAAPTNLFSPISAKDIIKTGEELISPYGVIRHSRDGGVGHGGIDFPLANGSPIYAVANGVVIKYDLEDPGGGKTVDILILSGEIQGEGWIFKYEHIALEQGLAVGSSVQKGQKIGTNAFEQRGNNHVGLEYHIRNFTIAREKICWVDLLESTAKQELENTFDQIKKTAAFLQSWQTANEEGYYQYRGLLDETKYSNGPQLCYRLGTDARIPTK